MKAESKEQVGMAIQFLDELDECIVEGCADSLKCFLDNMARAGVRFVRDPEMISSTAYLEYLLYERDNGGLR